MATLNIPNSFTAGTPAVASQVNSNFAAVKTFVEAISVGTNIDNGVITQAKLATAVVNRLVPVGSISAYAGTTAPTGWLMCDGTSTAGYPALAALVGATTPDMRGRFPIGDDATLTLLGVGGSSTISVANLPAHSHTNTASASTSVTVNSGGSHAHTASSTPAGSHAHGASSGGAGAHDHTFDTGSSGSHSHPLILDILSSITNHGHGGDSGYPMAGSGTGSGTTGSDTYQSVHSHSGTTSYLGNHSHTVSVDSAGEHSHGITVDSGGSHSHSASATTTVTMTNADTGSGSAYLQPHLVVNFIIKHD